MAGLYVGEPVREWMGSRAGGWTVEQVGKQTDGLMGGLRADRSICGHAGGRVDECTDMNMVVQTSGLVGWQTGGQKKPERNRWTDGRAD